MRVGIINIGASAFRMHIAEYVGEDAKTLDFLIMPLRLGTDTFTKGYISLEKVKQAAEILQKFKHKLEEYDVTTYRALCTSGVREASNRDFFLDYTYLHSGIKLKILEPAEEIYIKYVGARNSVDNFELMEQDGLVFVNVSSGNVTLNITSGNRFVYAGTLPYGSLRLRQMFKGISHLRRHRAIEEYLRVMLKNVSHRIDKVKLTHLVGAGSSVNLMTRVFGLCSNRIELTQLEELYAHVKTMKSDEIVEHLGVRQDEAKVLVPTVITYLELMKMLKAKEFTFSSISFPQTMSLYYSKRIKDPKSSVRVKSTLHSLALKYNVNLDHAKWVNKFAKKLFDELQDIHSLGKVERDILYAASILCDVGAYLGEDAIPANSYYIIKSLNIPGISSDILKLAAWVAYEVLSPAGTMGSDRMKPNEYTSLDSSEMLLILKLAAILRIAKSLDMAQAERISDISIEMGESVVIVATAKREPYLEIHAFEQQKRLFIETFGISIELRVRIRYD